MLWLVVCGSLVARCHADMWWLIDWGRKEWLVKKMTSRAFSIFNVLRIRRTGYDNVTPTLFNLILLLLNARANRRDKKASKHRLPARTATLNERSQRSRLRSENA